MRSEYKISCTNLAVPADLRVFCIKLYLLAKAIVGTDTQFPCLPRSEYKIDASYLSPNVNLAARLQGATKQSRAGGWRWSGVWRLVFSSVLCSGCRRVLATSFDTM